MPILLIAAAALPAFAGIQLGAIPDLPACEHRELPSGMSGERRFSANYKAHPSKTCIQPATDDRPGISTVTFPDHAEPEIMWGHQLDLTIIDGKVEGVRMFTVDHNFYQQVVASLTAKFGKPTSISRDEVEVVGIAVPSREYIWARRGYRVDYEVINDMESGVVVIETDKAMAFRKQNEAADSAKQTKL